MTSVIASVEDTLGVPSPDEMAEAGEEPDEETRRLAECENIHWDFGCSYMKNICMIKFQQSRNVENA